MGFLHTILDKRACRAEIGIGVEGTPWYDKRLDDIEEDDHRIGK